VVLLPELLHAPHAGAHVLPVVGGDLHLVDLLEDRLEVVQRADGRGVVMIAPGHVLAGTAEQDGLLDALDRDAVFEPLASQDLVGCGEGSRDTAALLE